MPSLAPVCFDSNIWVYSFNTTSTKYNTARTLRQKAIDGSIQVYASPQIITESFRVLTDKRLFLRPYTTTEAMHRLDFLQTTLPFMYSNRITMKLLSTLTNKYYLHIKSLTIYDVFLVATMLTHNIKTLYTDNLKDFKYYTEISVHNPFK